MCSTSLLPAPAPRDPCGTAHLTLTETSAYFADLKEGDILEAYTTRQVERELA